MPWSDNLYNLLTEGFITKLVNVIRELFIDTGNLYNFTTTVQLTILLKSFSPQWHWRFFVIFNSTGIHEDI